MAERGGACQHLPTYLMTVLNGAESCLAGRRCGIGSDYG